jgi:hypothetical protein
MSYIWQKQQTEPGMIIFVKSMEQAVLDTGYCNNPLQCTISRDTLLRLLTPLPVTFVDTAGCCEGHNGQGAEQFKL